MTNIKFNNLYLLTRTIWATFGMVCTQQWPLNWACQRCTHF